MASALKSRETVGRSSICLFVMIVASVLCVSTATLLPTTLTCSDTPPTFIEKFTVRSCPTRRSSDCFVGTNPCTVQRDLVRAGPEVRQKVLAFSACLRRLLRVGIDLPDGDVDAGQRATLLVHDDAAQCAEGRLRAYCCCESNGAKHGSKEETCAVPHGWIASQGVRAYLDAAESPVKRNVHDAELNIDTKVMIFIN